MRGISIKCEIIYLKIYMTKKSDTTFIQIVHPVCCELDVHKKKISACLITIDEHGQKQYEIEEVVTFTNNFILSTGYTVLLKYFVQHPDRHG